MGIKVSARMVSMGAEKEEVISFSNQREAAVFISKVHAKALSMSCPYHILIFVQHKGQAVSLAVGCELSRAEIYNTTTTPYGLTITSPPVQSMPSKPSSSQGYVMYDEYSCVTFVEKSKLINWSAVEHFVLDFVGRFGDQSREPDELKINNFISLMHWYFLDVKAYVFRVYWTHSEYIEYVTEGGTREPM